MLARLYRNGDDKLRVCVITGALEQRFADRKIVRFFADWKHDPQLKSAYSEARGYAADEESWVSPHERRKWPFNMLDALGTTRYTYTASGQLLTEDGPFASDTVTNIYQDRLRTGLRLQQPTGLWTNEFGYDAARRLIRVTSPSGSFTNEFFCS